MPILDVNLLVAAALSTHPHHNLAATTVKSALEKGGVGVPDVVWSGFVRVITNPAAVKQTISWQDIQNFISFIRTHPGYDERIRGMTGSLDSFVSLCQAVNARGNLVSDVYIACTAIDHSCEVISFDTDFDALPVKVIHPNGS